MGQKVLMKGNEAFGEAAIRAGCRFYVGYPITPQNELVEYMSRELPKWCIPHRMRARASTAWG